MKRWWQALAAALLSACSLARSEQSFAPLNAATATEEPKAVMADPPTAALVMAQQPTSVAPTLIPTVIPPTMLPSPTLSAQEQLLAQLPNLGRAPELYNEVWLNTDRPLRLAGLLGNVVLLDFWTFD